MVQVLRVIRKVNEIATHSQQIPVKAAAWRNVKRVLTRLCVDRPMRITLLAVLFALAACDSPSPTLGAAQPTRLHMDGYDITVWRADDRVEAIRHGFARRADKGRLRATLVRAMKQATGCALRDNSVEGDIGVLRAKLDC
jgi:hypothetical protein